MIYKFYIVDLLLPSLVMLVYSSWLYLGIYLIKSTGWG